MAVPNGGVGAIDIDGDGRSEIDFYSNSAIHFLRYDGNSWGEAAALQSSSAPRRAVDLNGDGRRDLILLSDGMEIWLATAGGYQRAPGSWLNFSVRDVDVADIDRDGIPDLVLLTGRSNGPGAIDVRRGNGDGTFSPYARTMTSGPVAGLALGVADLDGDAYSDVIVSMYQGIDALRNICAPERIRVAPMPGTTLNAGGRVTLLIHATPNDIMPGTMTITGDGVNYVNSYSSASWTSPPLTSGKHTFTIKWQDAGAAPLSTSITITATPVPPRGRSVRH
jgi:hypothetical protein